MSGLKYALLCQVALGEINVVSSHYRAEGETNDYDSLKVLGQQYPDPLYNMTLESGVILPIGPVTNCDRTKSQMNYGFNIYNSYNEYVVANKTHTVVRYVVVFE